jgi:glycosyltransferase involved in cell wall biosynthesis
VLCSVATSVVVHSQQCARQLVRHYDIEESRVHRVSHGIFFSKMTALDSMTSRRDLGVDDAAGVILLFGAVRGYKGVDVLLRAFREVVDADPGVHLMIAGNLWIDWTPHQELLERLDLVDRVHLFFGYVPDDRVPVFFSAADLVVLPYTSFDSQSGVGATALPYLKPMVVSRTGGLPEWVGLNESWIVPPGDVAALARRLISFFGDRERQVKAYRRLAEKVLDSADWNGVLDAYGPIYSPTTGQKSVG